MRGIIDVRVTSWQPLNSNKLLVRFVAVMLLGALIYGVKYSIEEYLCTFLVAGGVSVFALFKVTTIFPIPPTIYYF
jgi:hypothetical protein